MKKNVLEMLVVFMTAIFCLTTAPSAKTIKNTFVHLERGVPGVLYEPDIPGSKAEIAVIAMHPGGDYLTYPPCLELAKRGYRALGANCSTSKSGFKSDNNADKLLLNVKAAVSYLRKYPGVKNIVLLGHSGGGGLMAGYANISENGVKICRGSEKIVPCPDILSDMPPVDGLMLIDANIGGGAMPLFSLDPAIVSEDNGQALNPELNMYNPENGYNPKGSTYSEAFKKKFFAAVAARENRLIDYALYRLKKIEAGQGNFSDDEPLIVPAGNFVTNKLFTEDLSLWAQTKNTWPLLHPDGTITTETIHSVRVPRGAQSPSASLHRAGLTTTVRNFLNSFALRTTGEFGYDGTSFYGIDYQSSYNNVVGSVETVTIPLLIMGMTGSYEFFSAETFYNHAKSDDKTLTYVEGATHNFDPCKPCAVAQGKPEDYYGDTLKTMMDYIDGWLSGPGRF